MEKLEAYEALLRKWQKAINLVGPNTLDDISERHFFDSAQMFRYIPDVDVRLADLGSGAGFPGLVLAMLGVKDVHLVESDIRKATFLREVSRETGTPVTVHDIRIEDCKIENVDVVTARALSPLTDLLGHASRLTTPGHAFYCLFAKGGNREGAEEVGFRAGNFSQRDGYVGEDAAYQRIRTKNDLMFHVKQVPGEI